MSPSRDSSDPTCNPEISGRSETSLHRRVSYAITLHFLQTRAMRHISRCERYEKILRSTLSGNFSIVCKESSCITFVLRNMPEILPGDFQMEIMEREAHTRQNAQCITTTQIIVWYYAIQYMCGILVLDVLQSYRRLPTF